MVRLPFVNRCGPIGVDFGSRTLKLVQLDNDAGSVVEAVRWDLPELPEDDDLRVAEMATAIKRSMTGRKFRGREAVVCLGAKELFIQNIRVPKVEDANFQRLVMQETAGRIPFPIEESEVRYLEAADVRQGDSLRREVIVMAVHQPVLQRQLRAMTEAGLRPVAVDAEPAALLRCYVKQYRREDDHTKRVMFVHVGASQTAVVIAQGSTVLFTKYAQVGGRQFDEAVAQNLNISMEDAMALRRHNGDRRADQQDPEIMRSIAESVRPVIDQVAGEVSMCVRYHSVTFRGQPISRLVLGGGEASPGLVQDLGDRLKMTCELGDPLRNFTAPQSVGRHAQWDVATGLALRSKN